MPAANILMGDEFFRRIREELDDVLHWGMAFFKKRCLARAER